MCQRHSNVWYSDKDTPNDGRIKASGCVLAQYLGVSNFTGKYFDARGILDLLSVLLLLPSWKVYFAELKACKLICPEPSPPKNSAKEYSDEVEAGEFDTGSSTRQQRLCNTCYAILDRAGWVSPRFDDIGQNTLIFVLSYDLVKVLMLIGICIICHRTMAADTTGTTGTASSSSPPQPPIEVAVFWDYENTPLPRTVRPAEAAKAIQHAAEHLPSVLRASGSGGRSRCQVKMRRVYYDPHKSRGNKPADPSGLDSSGFDLVSTPSRNLKETVDKKLIVDLLTFAWEVRERGGRPLVVLITSDGDYSYALAKLNDRGGHECRHVWTG